MMYFKVVSLLLGTALLFFGAAYYFSPKAWVSFFAGKLWAQAGPVIILPLFIIHLILSLIGWMICLTGYKHPLAYFVSGLLTLGAAKLGCILPIYNQFSKVMALLVTTEKFSCLIFSIGSIVIGGGFIFLGAIIH
ncbi:MAG: hypothetical protein KBC91_00500 [Candidatus Omnitrophica bacterium]|nr:hypothetical protein [Candidatus Omnitrophota bacterium]